MAPLTLQSQAIAPSVAATPQASTEHALVCGQCQHFKRHAHVADRGFCQVRLDPTERQALYLPRWTSDNACVQVQADVDF